MLFHASSFIFVHFISHFSRWVHCCSFSSIVRSILEYVALSRSIQLLLGMFSSSGLDIIKVLCIFRWANTKSSTCAEITRSPLARGHYKLGRFRRSSISRHLITSHCTPSPLPTTMSISKASLAILAIAAVIITDAASTRNLARPKLEVVNCGKENKQMLNNMGDLC